MNQTMRSALALALMVGMPAAISAQQALGVGRPAPISRPVPPVSRPAPRLAYPTMPVTRAAPPKNSMPRVINPISGLRPLPFANQRDRIEDQRLPGIENQNRRVLTFVVIWVPAPFYWGGGFWGPWMSGTIASDLQEGAIADDRTNLSYTSYRIGIGSPGAELLADYGLEQTQCGAANLVVIWGPDNSVICALPNERIHAGSYVLDAATLRIKPQLTPPLR